MFEDSLSSLFICQPGYESFLRGELCVHGLSPNDEGRGWVIAQGVAPGELCFSHLQQKNPICIESMPINTIAAQLLDYFLAQVEGVILPEGWPLIFRFADGIKGLGQRTKAVEKEFRSRLKKRIARLERTASGELMRGGGAANGLAVFMVDFDRIYVSCGMWSGGQRRMADDPAAPSRSYLKTEEAFTAMGRAPSAGQTVVDLGAAPGGWSYSAAKRGASVIAIDNGPMKGGALNHPLIEHRRDDAFKFLPARGESYDWLFCDLVEEPHHVMRMVEQWLKGDHCRSFVVNLKFGHADAVKLLGEVLAPNGRLRPHCQELRVRHLFHDRDEFTMVGWLPDRVDSARQES
jgi:23S rRNA (cytidine2498-2'-O)-methyltransferase